jgi:hypothetical protein
MGSTFRRINTNAISCSSSGGVVGGGGTGAQQQQQQQPQQQQQQHGRQRWPGSFFVTNPHRPVHQSLVLVGLFLLVITAASNGYRYGCVVLQQEKTAESFDQKKAIEKEK